MLKTCREIIWRMNKPNSIYQDIWQLHMPLLKFVVGQITGSGLFTKQGQGHEFQGPHKKQGQS